MSYTAEIAKQEHPDAITVFVGPCIAKKFEGTQDQYVDHVLTYEELASFFLAKHIEIMELEEGVFSTGDATSQARRFCVDGGVAETVKHYAKEINPDVEVKPVFINGLDKKGLGKLKLAAMGKLPNCNLLECMSCEGGCLAGPGVIVPPNVSIKKLDKL
jgi:iron only hydrogenase large subunit-like protein